MNKASRFAQTFCVADNQRTAPAIHLSVAKAFHDDLGTNAGGITHGDADDRQESFVHENRRFLRILKNEGRPSWRRLRQASLAPSAAEMNAIHAVGGDHFAGIEKRNFCRGGGVP